ncbi:uncharacterized protein [Ptychodera flava]|uniref:uncharacterized protein n=1 Tax=Ptychodera flava TaxID=63121 RepID=UPI00396A82EE
MAVVKRSICVLTALTFITCFSLGQVTSHPVNESVHFKVWTDLLKTDHGNRTNKTIQIGMTWQNCGPSDPIHANVEISPDPIPIPGKVKISFNATLDITCDAPLRLKLKIKKKILGTIGQFIVLKTLDRVHMMTCVQLSTSTVSEAFHYVPDTLSLSISKGCLQASDKFLSNPSHTVCS